MGNVEGLSIFIVSSSSWSRAAVYDWQNDLVAETASGTDGSDSQARLNDGMDALNTWIQSSSEGKKGGLALSDATCGWVVADASDLVHDVVVRCHLGLNVVSNVFGK